MALFDTLQPPPPPSKIRRHFYTAMGVIVTIAVFVAAFPGYLWYPFVYYTRRKNGRKISSTQVIAGNTEQAYQIWKPSESYTLPRI